MPHQAVLVPCSVVLYRQHSSMGGVSKSWAQLAKLLKLPTTVFAVWLSSPDARLAPGAVDCPMSYVTPEAVASRISRTDYGVIDDITLCVRERRAAQTQCFSLRSHLTELTGTELSRVIESSNLVCQLFRAELGHIFVRKCYVIAYTLARV